MLFQQIQVNALDLTRNQQACIFGGNWSKQRELPRYGISSVLRLTLVDSHLQEDMVKSQVGGLD